MDVDETGSEKTKGDDNYALIHATVLGSVVVLGSSTNALVILTYLKWRRDMLKSPRDILILSMALGGFVISSCVSPLGFVSAVRRKWTTNITGCYWYGCVTTWIGLSSVLQLTCIATDRYLTFSNPFSRCSHISRKRARRFTLICWFSTGVVSCLPLVGWSEYTFEGLGFHCSIVWSSSNVNYGTFSVFLLVFFFLIPLGLIIFSYTKVYRIVHKMSSDAEAMWGIGNRATRESYMAEVKVAKQLFLVTGGFLFAWMPYAAVCLVSVMTNATLAPRYNVLPVVFAKTSYVYNPVIYFFTYKKLRRRSFEMLYNSLRSFQS